jgi:hypothetical protein
MPSPWTCGTVATARFENRIKNLKDCGLERMPFTSFTANAAWMEIVLTAAVALRNSAEPTKADATSSSAVPPARCRLQ